MSRLHLRLKILSLYAGTSEILIPSSGYVILDIGRILQSLIMILIQSGARAEMVSYLLLSVDSQGILLHICGAQNIIKVFFTILWFCHWL
jgi:hypothetical protein